MRRSAPLTPMNGCEVQTPSSSAWSASISIGEQADELVEAGTLAARAIGEADTAARGAGP